MAGAVLYSERSSDLALIHAQGLDATPLPIRSVPAQLGEPVLAFGFPFSGLLSSGGSVTTGIVSTLEGLRGDRRQIQVTAPVQPGNSGGPLLDAQGRVIGVVQGKLNDLALLGITGSLPQNVNFAVSAPTLLAMLRAQAVAFAEPPPGPGLSTTALASAAVEGSVLVRCVPGTVASATLAAPMPPPTERPIPPPGSGRQSETPPNPSGTSSAPPAPSAAEGAPATIASSTSPPGPDATFRNAAPAYPEAARRRGEVGSVRVELSITTDGRVIAAQVIGSSGFPMLDAAARRAAEGWRFRPAMQDGQPVPGTIRTSLHFRLQ